MADFQDLPTEARNPESSNIDQLSTLEMLRVINRADQKVADAVAAELPQIAAAVDGIVTRMQKGGRLFYIGAGTSGRLGVLDASEASPTFNVPSDLVQGIMAGGDAALRNALEDVEDDPAQGESDLRTHGVTEHDSLVGISTSGRTPYVLGALAYARSMGALTIGLSCASESPIARSADIAISPIVGAEVVTGSTRMKAGTATKMVLNMLSTGAMIRLGYVYGNLMVNVQMTNEKLVDRARRIVEVAADVDTTTAAQLLEEAGSVKTAIVMQRLGLSRKLAEKHLAAHNGHLRQTLESQT
jgi:N-acetylmuramic acid 6-phosphate etherase